jgi:hypothetical protein
MTTFIKKIIVVLFLRKLTNKGVRDFARTTSTSATDHAGDYPTFDPTPTVLTGLANDGQTIADEISTMQADLKTLNENEEANRVAIEDALNKWAGTVEGMDPLTVALVKQLGFGVKGDGPAPDKTQFYESSPVVIKSNQNVSKKIELHLGNSATGRKPKPYGAEGYMPYTQVGGTRPVSHEGMTQGNPLKEMKYAPTFTDADLNKQLYLCFSWYNGKGEIGPDSPIYSFTII